MVYSKEYSALIIVGFWNNAIFNPEWVAKYLLPKQPFNVDIAMNVNGSFRMSTNNFRIFVLDSKLHFSVINSTDETFREIEAVAKKVSEYLPHTPVNSFGINFVFENENKGQLDDICETRDTDNFEKAGFKVSEMSIKRQFITDGQILNLTINKGTNKLLFDFNYHFTIKTLVDFKELFEDEILILYKNKSIDILRDFYKLEMNGN